MKCCICGRELDGYGNNPEPVMPMETEEGKNWCCTRCDGSVVIPARIYIDKLIKQVKEQ